MLSLKTLKKWPDLFHKVSFSYESVMTGGINTIFNPMGLQIFRYTKDPVTSKMKKQTEITFKEFDQLPKSASLYFVKGTIYF